MRLVAGLAWTWSMIKGPDVVEMACAAMPHSFFLDLLKSLVII
jgi:hypothetical protein